MDEEERLTERFQIVVSPSFLERLDEWRRGQPAIPSRSEAIRELVKLGLQAQKQPRSRPRA